MSIKRLLILSFLLSFSFPGFSQSFESSDSGVEACTDSERLNDLVCLDGVGAGTYGFDNVRLTAGNFSAATNNASSDEATVANRRIGDSNLDGVAAGGHFSGWGFWGSFGNTEYDGSLPINAPIGRVVYDGSIQSILFGADKLITDQFVLGLALGYEESEAFTFYNGGNNHSDGFTIAPYAAFFINDVLSIDAAFGYTQLEYDTDRVSLATAGTTNFGSYDSDRWFASVNLNASTNLGQFLVSSRVGYLYTEEDQDAYTETGGADARAVSSRQFDLSQISLGIEVAYDMTYLFPYAGITWAHDLDRETGGNGLMPGLPGGVQPTFTDNNELQLAFGLHHYGEMISVMLDVNAVLDRDSFDSHSVMFTIRTDL